MTKAPLTAELCATAIVAACRSYGADPIIALSGGATRAARRGLPPAFSAICEASGASMYRVCKCLNFPTSSVSTAKKRAGAPYQRALTSALAAMGGARLVLAPTAPTRSRRPDPETVSGKPDLLLAPNPVPVVDLGDISDLALEPPRPALPAPADDVEVIKARPSPPSVQRPAGRALAKVATPSPRRGSPGGAPPVFAGMVRDAQEPARARDAVSDTDKALIEAAIAEGKVRVVEKDDGTELLWDPDRGTYARVPRSECELVPGHGWRKLPSAKQRGLSAAMNRRKALAAPAGAS